MSDALPKAKNRTLGSIEFGRGVAALLVVLYHASRHVAKETGEMPFSSAFLFGHAGVDFFFVISGFIIYYVHSAHFGDLSQLPRYLVRRISRIYPLFWVALGFAALLLVSRGEALPTGHMLSLDALLWPGDSLVGVSWTLHFEMMFYAFFALFLVFGRRVGVVLCVLWVGLILHFMAFGTGKAPTVLDSYNLQFLMGMVVAHVALHSQFSKRQSGGLVLGGIALFAATALMENTDLLNGYGDVARIFYGVPAALIVLGSAQLDRYHEAKPWQIGVFFGSLSYSIYLMHLFGVALANRALGMTDLGLVLSGEAKALVLAVAGVAFGVIVGLLIERPLQKLVKARPKPSTLTVKTAG